MTAALLTTLDLATHVSHGDPHAPWGLIGLGFAAWAVLGGAGKKNCKSKRPPAAASQFKRCGDCQIEHPHFAAYCRQCGRKF